LLSVVSTGGVTGAACSTTGGVTTGIFIANKPGMNSSALVSVGWVTRVSLETGDFDSSLLMAILLF